MFGVFLVLTREVVDEAVPIKLPFLYVAILRNDLAVIFHTDLFIGGPTSRLSECLPECGVEKCFFYTQRWFTESIVAILAIVFVRCFIPRAFRIPDRLFEVGHR